MFILRFRLAFWWRDTHETRHVLLDEPSYYRLTRFLCLTTY